MALLPRPTVLPDLSLPPGGASNDTPRRPRGRTGPRGEDNQSGTSRRATPWAAAPLQDRAGRQRATRNRSSAVGSCGAALSAGRSRRQARAPRPRPGRPEPPGVPISQRFDGPSAVQSESGVTSYDATVHAETSSWSKTATWGRPPHGPVPAELERGVDPPTGTNPHDQQRGPARLPSPGPRALARQTRCNLLQYGGKGPGGVVRPTRRGRRVATALPAHDDGLSGRSSPSSWHSRFR